MKNWNDLDNKKKSISLLLLFLIICSFIYGYYMIFLDNKNINNNTTYIYTCKSISGKSYNFSIKQEDLKYIDVKKICKYGNIYNITINESFYKKINNITILNEIIRNETIKDLVIVGR